MSPTRKQLLGRLFLHYGAGAELWQPITRARAFNIASWTIVIIASIAWAVDLIWYYFF